MEAAQVRSWQDVNEILRDGCQEINGCPTLHGLVFRVGPPQIDPIRVYGWIARTDISNGGIAVNWNVKFVESKNQVEGIYHGDCAASYR